VRLLAVLAGLALAIAPGAARGQIFVASTPHPDFTVGPLLVRASVTPAIGPTVIDVFFSLVIPPRRSAIDLEQDIHLLWPGALRGTQGGRDEALVRFAESRGFTVVGAGAMPLYARTLYRTRGAPDEEAVPSGAPYVTFVQDVETIGRSTPVTWIRIPWNPKLVNRAWLMDVRLTAEGFIQPKAASWLEHMFSGPRYRAVLSFNDVRGRGAFPLYLEHRDRVIRLSEDPAQLLVTFADADHLKIDELAPPSASRRHSQARGGNEVVSLFLDRSEGLLPQALTVQFGYFTSLQTWAPVLIPFLFFVAGNVAGVFVRTLAERLRRILSARVSFWPAGGPAVRAGGVSLSRDTLDRIVPGETTYEEVVRLCGPETEQHEDVRGGHRTLAYRGRRVVPEPRRTFGWFRTVSHWNVEHHEVEISFDGDRVADVQARVSRTRPSSPDEV
jgi:hypothetical protein